MLNGCDSRFLIIRFIVVEQDFCTDEIPDDPVVIPFTVIGGDQGLGDETLVDIDSYLVMENGARYDIILDFTGYEGKRVIIQNLGADEPYKGKLPDQPVVRQKEYKYTDRIMAFDVKETPGCQNEIRLPSYHPKTEYVNRSRKLALFEGTDDRNRLQPLLGNFN